MIFECVDRIFGGIAAVGVWGDKLEVNVVFAEGFFHCLVSIIVENVDSGGCTILE